MQMGANITQTFSLGPTSHKHAAGGPNHSNMQLESNVTQKHAAGGLISQRPRITNHNKWRAHRQPCSWGPHKPAAQGHKSQHLACPQAARQLGASKADGPAPDIITIGVPARHAKTSPCRYSPSDRIGRVVASHAEGCKVARSNPGCG